MGLRDIIAKARTSTTGSGTRHRDKIDQRIDKVGEVANARTGDATKPASAEAARIYVRA